MINKTSKHVFWKLACVGLFVATLVACQHEITREDIESIVLTYPTADEYVLQYDPDTQVFQPTEPLTIPYSDKTASVNIQVHTTSRIPSPSIESIASVTTQDALEKSVAQTKLRATVDAGAEKYVAAGDLELLTPGVNGTVLYELTLTDGRGSQLTLPIQLEQQAMPLIISDAQTHFEWMGAGEGKKNLVLAFESDELQYDSETAAFSYSEGETSIPVSLYANVYQNGAVVEAEKPITPLGNGLIFDVDESKYTGEGEEISIELVGTAEGRDVVFVNQTQALKNPLEPIVLGQFALERQKGPLDYLGNVVKVNYKGREILRS